MIGHNMRHILIGMAALGALVWSGSAAPACPFCTMQGQTLTDEVKQASMVLYGELKNAQLTKGEFGEGTTELIIEAVVKPHEIVQGKKIITLPRYVPTDGDGKYKFLIFCDVFKGRIDPYRGVALKPDSDMVKYLKGSLAVKDQDDRTRLRFFFQYLDNPDIEISNDAYKEFGNTDYRDYQELAKELPADKIAGWLQDPDTPAFRFGTYASLLGHCGNDKHAAVLRGMLDNKEKRLSSGVDGILAGYTMLQPKEGWEYTRGLLGDAKKEFVMRYAALRTVRFLWEFRPDLVSQSELVEGLRLMLAQPDISDLAIEDLRKWKRWETCEQILALFGQESHDIPIIRRAILRYALSCPTPQATEFVQAMRRKDADWVKDVEDLLKLETSPPPPPAKAAAK